MTQESPHVTIKCSQRSSLYTDHAIGQVPSDEHFEVAVRTDQSSHHVPHMKLLTFAQSLALSITLFSVTSTVAMAQVPVIPDNVVYNPLAPDTALVSPSAPSWKQIGIGSVNFKKFILPKPPTNTSAQTALELEELNALAATRNDPNVQAIIFRWNNDPPGQNYNPYFDYLAQKNGFTPPEAARCAALLNEGLYTGLLAAWNNKWTYLRPRPDQVTGYVFQAAAAQGLPTPNHPAYPSGHSASAGIFMSVGPFCFPEEPLSTFVSFGKEASLARRQAGVHYYSDSVAGEALGYSIGSALTSLYLNDKSDFSGNPAAPVYTRPPTFDNNGTPTTTLSPKRANVTTYPVLDGNQIIQSPLVPFPLPPSVLNPPAPPLPIPTLEPF